MLNIQQTFSKITDQRHASYVDHPLPALLTLVMLGKFCGKHTLKSTFRMSRRLPRKILLRIGCKEGKAPAYTTFTKTMQALDADEVRLVFATAVRGFGLEEDEVVAVDGNMIITGDAIFTQKEICNKITQKNADFVFTVKANQARLRHKIKGLINAAEAGFSPANKRSSNHKRRSRKV